MGRGSEPRLQVGESSETKIRCVQTLHNSALYVTTSSYVCNLVIVKWFMSLKMCIEYIKPINEKHVA